MDRVVVTSQPLERFLQAQDRGDPASYATALRELRAGRKHEHWIWYLFPQLRGLGRSGHSSFYGIDGIDEARNYLQHPLLRERYHECLLALLQQLREGQRLKDVLGGGDAQKLVSSITLMRQALILEKGQGEWQDASQEKSSEELLLLVEAVFAEVGIQGYQPCRATRQSLG